MITLLEHAYGDGEISMVGRLAYDTRETDPKPGVLIAPAFGGVGDFVEKRAMEIASKGYVVLVADYYGDGKYTEDHDEAASWMTEVNADRALFARRMVCALKTLKELPQVDATRTAAMGYCLGGKAVLDLARTGADFQACVPIHGVLEPPPSPTAAIKASVLVLHGWDDPLALPDAVVALASELTQAGADWQMLALGQTGHSFTNPAAQSPEEGMAYSLQATNRSMALLHAFFEETLA